MSKVSTEAIDIGTLHAVDVSKLGRTCLMFPFSRDWQKACMQLAEPAKR